MSSTNQRPGEYARTGFTLVELVIVVLVVGVLSAVAAPRFAASLEHRRMEAAAARVAADIEYARRYARTKGKTQSVVFTAASHSYDLPGVADIDHSSQSFSVDLTATTYPCTIVSVALGAGGTGNTVVFDMHGRPDFGGTVVLAVGSIQRTLTIDAVSGETTITP